MRLIGAEEDELFRQFTAVCMDEWAKADGKSLLSMHMAIARQQHAAPKLSAVYPLAAVAAPAACFGGELGSVGARLSYA
jgi:hypothetical protein